MLGINAALAASILPALLHRYMQRRTNVLEVKQLQGLRQFTRSGEAEHITSQSEGKGKYLLLSVLAYPKY